MLASLTGPAIFLSPQNATALREHDGDKAEAAGAAWALARRPEADRAQIEALLAQAKGVGVAAFPAAAHASLAQSYLRGRPGSDLRKRARITWAALTGRL